MSDKEINDFITEEFMGYCIHDLKYQGAYAQCQKCGEIYAAAYVPNNSNNRNWINDPKMYIELLDELTKKKLEWSLYSFDDGTYEMEITDPELSKKRSSCYDSRDPILGLANNSNKGRAICLAILNMKGINIK